MNKTKHNPVLDNYYSCMGENLVLYRFQPYFTHFIFRSYQHSKFIENYRLHQQFTNDKNALQQDLLNKQSLPPQMLKSMEWVICLKQSKQAIGLAGLVNYHQQHRSAELLVGLLPELSNAQQSYGPEATMLVLEFAFKEIALHKLVSMVYGYNQKAQKSTLKLGFTQEGLLRQHILDSRADQNSNSSPQTDSPQYIDLYYNALLREDFYAHPKLARLSKRLLKRDITEVEKQADLQKNHLLTETLIPDLIKKTRINP